MRRVGFTVLAIGVGCVLGFFIASRTLSVRGAAKPGTGAVAIPGQVGGQDIFGAYNVVKGWPKDISTLPGNGGAPLPSQTRALSISSRMRSLPRLRTLWHESGCLQAVL